jgi:hypothetical protein
MPLPSNVWIGDVNQANKVFFDADPTPFPVFAFRKFGAIKRSIPTRNSGTNAAQSGITIAMDTGSDLSSVELDIEVVYMTAANFAKLVTLFSTIGKVTYSPDNGITVYTCAWRPGPIGLRKDAGWLNYRGTLRLQVLSQLVGSGGVGGPGGGG